ncbi:quaternary ammonium compound-resistance protein SugE [Litorivivens lipolytica]|uniref:Guanidinium exporter n=1 Tax=Litorivivens lipolytica TaxID=1524264 RepID=A0A7W4W388_9GAMM|nr:multidrug efflux SMR transporter [Litorivivens lipolytica]MBB3046642.1 quaternary ammonium compound-resistance protein SugE [Litorivivens lipolytica]
MAWLILLLAGVSEIIWVLGLKTGIGAARPWLTLVTVAAMVVSVVLLEVAMRYLPVGTAYTVWVGIGACGAVVAGVVWFGEPMGLIRIVSLICVVLGIVGLKLTSA